MAKKIPLPRIDLQLQQAEGTRIHLCSAEPTDYADITNVELGAATISGSYTKANGDVSGRKNTLPAQTGIPVTADGTCNHVAISDGTANLTLVTTVTSPVAVTSGGTADTTAFAHEVQQAV